VFSVAEYVRVCPKVELHVHLEGAIRPARLLAILRRHGTHADLRHPQDVAHLFRHADFAEFLAHFRFVVLSLRDVEDIHAIARDLFLELAAQNVVYAEVIFSAPVFVRGGLPLEELVAAVSEAAAAGEEAVAAREPHAPAPRYNFVIDLVRNLGAAAALSSVEAIAALAHPRIVGIHLGGDEVGFPARDFAAAFAAAAAAGLGRAAHAGEAAGPESVRDAVRVLGATRIGHGIRSLEDPRLVEELIARDITLEVCPTSNLRTGVVADWGTHPLPHLVAAGLPITIGADDPSYFDTDLARELVHVHERFGLPVQTLDQFADRGIAAAFVPAAERAARLAALATARARARRAVSARSP
jgi:adenosine deaminase